MMGEDLPDPNQIQPVSPPPTPASVAVGGRQGTPTVRAGWRLLIYFLLLFALGATLTVATGILIRPSRLAPLTSQLFMEMIGFGTALGAAAILSQMEQRPVGDYGLPVRGLFGGKFWLGFLFGIVEICVLMGLIGACRGYSFGSLALQGSQILGWGAFHLLFFFVVGLFEEFLFRGYTQFTLGDGIGFWPAALVLSLGFGAVHLRQPGEGPIGAASVALVGLFFCFTLQRTGNLWYAVGLHTSFDWGETFLFSVPDSGTMMQGHLSNAVLAGPKWLTGGSVGPEGSVFCFLTMGLQFLVVALFFPARAKNEMARAEKVAG